MPSKTTSTLRELRTLATVEAHGFTVCIKERKGQRNLCFEYEVNDDRVRRSAKTPDLEKAKSKATVLARELAKVVLGRELGLDLPDDGRLSLEVLFAHFRRKRMPRLKKPRPGHTASYAKQLDVAMRAFTACLGSSFTLDGFDQNTVAYFTEWRIDPVNRFRLAGKNKGGLPPTRKTAARDLSLMKEITAWATSTRVAGKVLLRDDPIRSLDLPSPKTGRLRPIMSEERLRAMRDAAPRAEAAARTNNAARNQGVPGYFPLLVELLAELGHRVTATALLQRRDVLRTPREVAEVAARYGLQPEACARAWRWGAVHFTGGNDKMGRASLVPLSRRMREQLDNHLAEMDALGRKAPDAYLLCMPSNPEKPLVGSSANHVLLSIEKFAVSGGMPLTHLKGGLAHPFRRRFRTIRAGRFDDALVAIAGGWTLAGAGADPSAMNQSYLIYPPESLLHCLEFEPARDLTDDSLPPGVKVKVHIENEDTGRNSVERM